MQLNGDSPSQSAFYFVNPTQFILIETEALDFTALAFGQIRPTIPQ
jgi:hypothetical protein